MQKQQLVYYKLESKNNMAKTKKETKEAVASNALVLTPRVTEKASILTDKSVYTFDVPLTTTKLEVKKAFVLKYKKIPVKLNSVRVSPRNVFKSGKRGKESAYKKVVVYLKKGETIEFAA